VDALKASVNHGFQATPLTLLGVNLPQLLFKNYVDARVDRAFREDRVSNGPRNLDGMRKTLRWVQPGLPGFVAKDLVDCTRRDLGHYREYVQKQIGSWNRIDTFIEELDNRMESAGAAPDAEVRPFLTDEEIAAFS